MKFRRDRKRRIDPRLDMTPLIDVVFQLLIFFMLSSTFIVQSTIQIEMPEAEGAAQLEQKDLSVTLAYGTGGPDGKGKIYVNSKEVPSIEELTRILSERAAERPDIMLLVRTDARTDTGRLVEVLGIASSVGIQKFGIGAQPPDDVQ
ncbi:MAG: biopolymer transporter ExbD [Candidatus Hydrogenedentes bacterium]|nr:biopolymer transporter ExbD [Candidatus Hydrogenedentota bacterium]